MVNGISSNGTSYASDSAQTYQVPQTQGTTVSQSAAKTTASDQDSVKLSSTEQAKLMLQEGMSVKEIAENLPLALQAVSSALGVTNTPLVVPVAVPGASSTKV